MDIREYLQTKEKGFYKILCNIATVERRKQFYDAVNNWHESELRLLNIHNVVGQSEQLVCNCQGCGEVKEVEYCEKCYAEHLPDIANKIINYQKK